jgi:hypothetical protein
MAALVAGAMHHRGQRYLPAFSFRVSRAILALVANLHASPDAPGREPIVHAQLVSRACSTVLQAAIAAACARSGRSVGRTQRLFQPSRRAQSEKLDDRARATAETQAHASSAKDQDRHLMMTELMLDICKYDQCLCWLPADNVIPCIVTSMLLLGKTQKRKIALLRRSVTRSQPNSRPCRVAKLRTLPPRSATSTPAPAAKPP